MKLIHRVFAKKLIKPVIKPLFAFLLITITLGLSACGKEGVLSPQGPVANSELRIIIFSIILMLIVVIPTIVMSLWFAYHYRENNNADYRPGFSHSTLLELVWWTIPCIIILILGVVTWQTSHSLDPYKPLESDKKPVKIDVIALDWKWLFIYPEYKIATINYIKIPTDRPINFRITSAAPMNSFIIPQLGGQIYAMTGMATKLHVQADHPGHYRGFSANYTGNGFAQMQFYTDATSEKEFRSWVRTVQRKRGDLTWDVFWNQLVKPSANDPVTYFGDVNIHLFDDVVMSYMMPNYHPTRLSPQQQDIVKQHKQQS